ncbi:hypothetical protein [Halosimplex marinum]|uniref:hypothetical protein n=1 Tax=Halosimplex marinum TaxID=3396620 RepID=UPI003F54F9BA
MGAVVAGSAEQAGAVTLESINQSDISTPDELESLRSELVSGECKVVSESFEAVSDYVEKATIHGDIDTDPEFSRFHDRAELRSFILKPEDGGAVRFTLEGDSVSVRRYGQSTDETDVELPEYQTVYFVGQVILFAMYSVDRFIDRNGLRPVVDEIKERRWVILVTCSILAAHL